MRHIIPTIAGCLVALVVAAPAFAREKPKSSDAVWYERVEVGCKLEAKKYYSAIHYKKRRAFVQHCIERTFR